MDMSGQSFFPSRTQSRLSSALSAQSLDEGVWFQPVLVNCQGSFISPQYLPGHKCCAEDNLVFAIVPFCLPFCRSLPRHLLRNARCLQTLTKSFQAVLPAEKCPSILLLCQPASVSLLADQRREEHMYIRVSAPEIVLPYYFGVSKEKRRSRRLRPPTTP